MASRMRGYGMQRLADPRGQPLDRGDLVRGLDLGDGHAAGVERLAVDVAGARLADPEAAPVLGAIDPEQVVEHPQQPDVVRTVDADMLAVEDERVLGHGRSLVGLLEAVGG